VRPPLALDLSIGANFTMRSASSDDRDLIQPPRVDSYRTACGKERIDDRWNGVAAHLRA
jgi:hypothetical protein